jgi:curved DNA-binding protein CbpA
MYSQLSYTATPYEILGVSTSATDKEIRTAFRKLARTWHPDKFKNGTPEQQQIAEKKFREISQAFQAIGKSYRPSEQSQPARKAAPAKRAAAAEHEKYEDFVFMVGRIEIQLEALEKDANRSLAKTRKQLNNIQLTTEEEGSYGEGYRALLGMGMALNLLDRFHFKALLVQEVLDKLGGRKADIQRIKKLMTEAFDRESITAEAEDILSIIQDSIPNPFSSQDSTAFEKELDLFAQTKQYTDKIVLLKEYLILFPASLAVLQHMFNDLKAVAKNKASATRAEPQSRPQQDPEVTAFVQKSETLLKTAPDNPTSQIKGLRAIVERNNEVSSFSKERLDEITAELHEHSRLSIVQALEQFNNQLTALTSTLNN